MPWRGALSGKPRGGLSCPCPRSPCVTAGILRDRARLKFWCTGWAFLDTLRRAGKYLSVGRGVGGLLSLLDGSGVPVRTEGESWVSACTWVSLWRSGGKQIVRHKREIEAQREIVVSFCGLLQKCEIGGSHSKPFPQCSQFPFFHVGIWSYTQLLRYPGFIISFPSYWFFHSHVWKVREGFTEGLVFEPKRFWKSL